MQQFKPDYSRQFMDENGGSLYIILSFQSKPIGIKLNRVFDFSVTDKCLMVWAVGEITPFAINIEDVDHVPNNNYSYHEVSANAYIAMMLNPAMIEPKKAQRWMHINDELADNTASTLTVTAGPELDIFSIYHSVDPYVGVTGEDSKGPWKLAGNVSAYSMNDAYNKSQHIEGGDWDENQRSTSVGDIIAPRTPNGCEAFLVLGKGFKRIENFFTWLTTLYLTDMNEE